MNENIQNGAIKKPFYKMWWFWVIAVFVVIVALSAGANEETDSKDKGVQQAEETTNTAEVNNGAAESEQTTNTDAENDYANVTTGQKNALRKAEAYLSTMAFSHDGLVKQLEYEGYSNEDSIYGADNCGADWNEQAAKKAESYLDMTAFSRDGLIEQLEYEGFSHEQALYAAEANGY